ncbi:type I phosphoribosyltransferase, partial [Staphylococcus epidermidis]
MESLGGKVKEDGVVMDEKILKVDGFLNDEIDGKLMNDVGKRFYECLKEGGISKILSIEGCGIGGGIMGCFDFDVGCVFGKKGK